MERALQQPQGKPRGDAAQTARRCLAMVLVLLGTAACQSEREREVAPSQQPIPQQIVEQMCLWEREAGRPRWCLVADSALTYAGEERTLVRGVAVEFYDDAGDSVRSSLTAREGEVDQRSGDLVARGQVVVVTAAGHRLETEELRWDNERSKVVSDCFVRLTKGESVVTGVGIETDAELRTYIIHSEVEGALQEEDGILDDL